MSTFRLSRCSAVQGRELFRRGVLSEAVLALEAEVQQSPRSVDAWRLLGTVHAENDDDLQARPQSLRQQSLSELS